MPIVSHTVAQAQRLADTLLHTLHGSKDGKQQPRLEQAEGATAAVGYVAAHLLRGGQGNPTGHPASQRRAVVVV